jgi:phage-related baseplate assembly protein
VEVDWEKINEKVEQELHKEQQRPATEKAAAKPARH